MKPIIIFITILGLTGCIVKPKNSHKTPQVKTKLVKVLELEHKDKSIIVVNIRPAKSRQCWQHNRHWHCRR